MDELYIALTTCASRRQKNWNPSELVPWSHFKKQLKTPKQISLSSEEFHALPKKDRIPHKDVGGYFAGTFLANKRGKSSIESRSVITLDVDHADAAFLPRIKRWDHVAFLHTTVSDREESPRYRLLVPLLTSVTPETYTIIANYLINLFGEHNFDRTSLEASRLMFWPTKCRNARFFWAESEGTTYLDPEKVLPEAELVPLAKATKSFSHISAVQASPLDKDGPIGVFCRTYTIASCIDEYLKDVYTAEGFGRYTYAKGTTSAGLVTYDNVFAYSHHSTDPAAGRLCNAFDLVRIHYFGHLPEKESVSKTLVLLKKDPAFQIAMEHEQQKQAKAEFALNIPEEQKGQEWVQQLEVSKKTKKPFPHQQNLDLIFDNDPALRGIVRYNLFKDFLYAYPSSLWPNSTEAVIFDDYHKSLIMNHLRRVYAAFPYAYVDDMICQKARENSYHPISEYLIECHSAWDGEPRINTLLDEYFGVVPSPYASAAMRKWLVAAVRRILLPGYKFDHVLIISSKKQGIGKSLFGKRLAGEFFTDTLDTTVGKEAYEVLRGNWIVELPELSSFRKSDLRALKKFFSTTEDVYRPAYGRYAKAHKRQCVFIGTTNEDDFLSDTTGNRRYWPVQAHPERITKVVYDALTQAEVDNIWGEAMHFHLEGESTVMPPELLEGLLNSQRIFTQIDPRSGLAEVYLEQCGKDEVCVMEIWEQALFNSRSDYNAGSSSTINRIMQDVPGWNRALWRKTFDGYGRQKYFRKVD